MFIKTEDIVKYFMLGIGKVQKFEEKNDGVLAAAEIQTVLMSHLMVLRKNSGNLFMI